MVNWSQGKILRLRRLIDPQGAILAVPMDHGYSSGVLPGLDDIDKTVGSVINGGASCVIMQRGMVRSVNFGKAGLMVHLSGSSGLSTRKNQKIKTGTVADAVRLGADGISCHVNVGCEGDKEMLSALSLFCQDSDEYNLPIMAMMYNRMENGKDITSIDNLAQIARLAEEAGADIVKIHATPKGEEFDEVLQGINIPVVIAGGEKVSRFPDFLKTVNKCIINGASGVSVGRNVFLAKNPEKAMKRIQETVHNAIEEVGGIEIIPGYP